MSKFLTTIAQSALSLFTNKANVPLETTAPTAPLVVTQKDVHPNAPTKISTGKDSSQIAALEEMSAKYIEQFGDFPPMKIKPDRTKLLQGKEFLHLLQRLLGTKMSLLNMQQKVMI